MKQPRNKQMIKQSNEKAKEQMSRIGPISTPEFKTVQEVLARCNEQTRYEICYNMLLMMKEQSDA